MIALRKGSVNMKTKAYLARSSKFLIFKEISKKLNFYFGIGFLHLSVRLVLK